MLYNSHDMYIGRSLELYSEYSEGEIDLFRQMVKPGDIVLEIGSNIGPHTVFLARQVEPGGHVFAFEPQRIVFQTLCANLALNSITNVSCFNQAVGAKPGEIVVPLIDYRQVANFGGLALGEFKQGEQIKVITIDSLLLPRCNLIKIDVEGMELSVLQGAIACLARFKPMLYVENDRREKSAELVRFLDSCDYDMYWHSPPLFNPQNFAGNAENVFDNIISRNMLCIHRSIARQLDGFQPVQVPYGTTAE